MLSRLAALGLLLAFAACAEDSGNNSVWLVVKNDTGRHITDFTLDYGAGRFHYQLFSAGLTHGDYARTRGHQPLSISYTDDTGARREAQTAAALSPDLIGGRLILTLRADGGVDRESEARSGLPPTWLDRLDDYGLWFQAAAVLVAIPIMILLAHKLVDGARTAKEAVQAAVKWTLAHPARDGAVATLGLVHKVCPVRMFTNNPRSPTWWYEGVLEGKTLGLLDYGVLWLGGPDEVTELAFARGPDGAFVPDDSFERDGHPIRRDEELLAALARFSPAVTSVNLLAEAVEVGFKWKLATAGSIVADANLLPAVRARVVAYDPPLVRAVLDGDAKAVAALVRAGAGLEAMTFGHLNAVTAAAAKDRADLLELLLAAGAKPMPECGRPLHRAAALGHLDVVRILLDAGVPVDFDDGYGTALIDAALYGRDAVVALLLERGADPNAVNSDRGTALGYAQDRKHEHVVLMLKAAGASDARRKS